MIAIFTVAPHAAKVAVNSAFVLEMRTHPATNGTMITMTTGPAILVAERLETAVAMLNPPPPK